MKKICIPPYVYSTFFQESAIILDARKNIYYTLNDSAANFWNFLIKSGSFEEALKESLNLYEGSSDTLRKDMEALVDSLVKTGLIQREKNPRKNWLLSFPSF